MSPRRRKEAPQRPRKPWVHPMERGERPRWFDGRVRRVVEVLAIWESSPFTCSIELLDCGHEYAPSGPIPGVRVGQARVCDQCEVAP